MPRQRTHTRKLDHPWIPAARPRFNSFDSFLDSINIRVNSTRNFNQFAETISEIANSHAQCQRCNNNYYKTDEPWIHDGQVRNRDTITARIFFFFFSITTGSPNAYLIDVYYFASVLVIGEIPAIVRARNTACQHNFGMRDTGTDYVLAVVRGIFFRREMSPVQSQMDEDMRPQIGRAHV